MNRAEMIRRQAGEISNILTLIAICALGNLMGEKGITYMAVAAEAYALTWSAVGGNLSDTLGRLLRSRRNKGQYRSAAKLRGNAMIFQVSLGLAGSVLLLIFARALAEKVFAIRYSALIIMVLSPVVLLRSVSCVLIGYFQGAGMELPGAVSGLMRQVLIVGFGILLAGLGGSYGEKVSRLLQEDDFTAMYSGMGIAFAIVLAELLIAITLALLYIAVGRSEKRGRQEGLFSTDSFGDCVASLCGRWPQALLRILECLPPMLGLLLLRGTMDNEDEMAFGYGVFVGKYLVICGVVMCLISIAMLPMTARIFTYLRREENRFARSIFQSGVHMCMVHGIFAAAFLAFLGTQFGEFLCAENGEIMAKMLQGGSCVAAFLALSAYFGILLRSTGKKYPLLAAAGIADIVFAATVALMQGTGKIGALSLVYGSMTGAFVLCILLGMLSCRQMRLRADWIGVLIIPSGAAVTSGFFAMLLGRLMSPHLGSLMTLIVTFLLAAAAYWIMLLLLRNFREQELEVIPGGRLIHILGQMLRVY